MTRVTTDRTVRESATNVADAFRVPSAATAHGAWLLLYYDRTQRLVSVHVNAFRQINP